MCTDFSGRPSGCFDRTERSYDIENVLSALEQEEDDDKDKDSTQCESTSGDTSCDEWSAEENEKFSKVGDSAAPDSSVADAESFD